MALLPVAAGPERALALVAGGDAHFRRFADDAEGGAFRPRRQRLDHAAHADAADLLVIGEGEMQRAFQRAGGGEEGRPQAGRDETLHIRSAAAVKAAVMLAEREGIAAPSLSLDRHDIRMARQDHTARAHRADGRPEIGAAAVGMGEPLDARARRAQKPFHIVEQREVRAARDGGFCDETGEDFRRRGDHGSEVARHAVARRT